jgi:hypothetical protein
MTREEVLARIESIEKAIATEVFSQNHTLILAGEWHGLRKAIGLSGEGVWAMVGRLTGM